MTFAFDASPSSRSTSAGRKYLASDFDKLVPVQIQLAERSIQKLANRVRFARRDHKVVRLVLLEHEPHRFDVVLGVAPVALRFEIAKKQLLLQPNFDARRRPRDLASHERFAPSRRFMIEQNAVDGEQAVAAPIVDRLHSARRPSHTRTDFEG